MTDIAGKPYLSAEEIVPLFDERVRPGVRRVLQPGSPVGRDALGQHAGLRRQGATGVSEMRRGKWTGNL